MLILASLRRLQDKLVCVCQILIIYLWCDFEFATGLAFETVDIGLILLILILFHHRRLWMRCKQSRIRSQLIGVSFVILRVVVCAFMLLSIWLVDLWSNHELIEALQWLDWLNILSIRANLNIQVHSLSFVITELLLVLLNSRSWLYLIKRLQALYTVQILQWLKLIESHDLLV